MSPAAPPLFVPAGDAEAAWVEGAGGVRLRTALFPAASPRGSVVLSPGRTEFIEKYREVVEDLRARGFTVLVHDWRGQGLSDRLASGDPLKGHAAGVDPFLDDLACVVARHAASLPRPWIAVGHSMGGALTLASVASRRLRPEAVVLSAPMLGIATGSTPRWAARAAAWSLTRLGRAQAYAQPAADPLDDPFEDNPLTHDRGRWERTRSLLLTHPQLRLGQVTWGWLDFALSLTARLHRAAPSFPAPLSVVAAGDERLADTAATVAFCRRAPGADCEVVPGALHEILMEEDMVRARFWRAFDTAAARVMC